MSGSWSSKSLLGGALSILTHIDVLGSRVPGRAKEFGLMAPPKFHAVHSEAGMGWQRGECDAEPKFRPCPCLPSKLELVLC